MINAFLIAQGYIGGRKDSLYTSQRRFQESVAWGLVYEGCEDIDAPGNPSRPGVFTHGNEPGGNTTASRQGGYVGKHYSLPACRKAPGNHLPIKGTIAICVFCRYLRQKTLQDPNGREAELFLHELGGPHGSTRRSSFVCQECEVGGKQVALCRNVCFKYWHEL